MASRKKYYHYVLVFTNSGPKYVTSKNNADRTAYWKEEDKPLAMSKEDAEFMAVALTWNGNSSVMVTSTYELDTHPYNYKNWGIKFVEKPLTDE